ncbi:hypothetical protein R6Y99_11090, partial [Pseudomonas lundensis]|uniref:hypothetical protein n=1 Tax=Serratia proteamaculans TaxID=28151 RepID=UPI002981FCF7
WIMPPRSPVMDMGLCNWSEIRISYLGEWSLSGYQKVKDIVKTKLDGCIVEFGKESNLKLLASDLEAIKNAKS